MFPDSHPIGFGLKGSPPWHHWDDVCHFLVRAHWGTGIESRPSAPIELCRLHRAVRLELQEPAKASANRLQLIEHGHGDSRSLSDIPRSPACFLW